MKKQNRTPAYSAKPGESTTVTVKDYTEPKIIGDTGWIENHLTGIKERTTVEKKGNRYDVTIQAEGGLFLPPANMIDPQKEFETIYQQEPEPDDFDDENGFEPCDHCDLPDACADFGCAIKTGVSKNYPIDGIF